MGALQVLVLVTSAVLLLENGSQLVGAAPSGGTYSITTVHRSSSPSANSIAPSAYKAPAAAAAASPAASSGRGNLGIHDYRRYLPVEDTPEVRKARQQFFRLYEKQARLAAEAPDNDLDGYDTRTHVMTKTEGDDRDYDYYYYDYAEDEDEEDEGEGSEEEGSDSDDDEGEEDSEEGGEGEEDSSESDDEDDDSSSEEDGDGDDSSSSSEEGESSSSEEGDDDDSSSSSEEDDDEARDGRYSFGVQRLNTNSLSAPRAVTDTPEVKQAKRNFFNLYKTQAELSFRAPDNN